MDKLAIVTPSRSAISETFILAHIERLPAKAHVLHGGHLPTHADGEPLIHNHSALARGGFLLKRRLRGLPGDWEARRRTAVEAFLRRQKIQVVLAEYGPTGVAMMELCARAGIPLVVHFHGYDAYKSSVLEENRHTYPTLFRRAAAVVAVSQDMVRQLGELGAPSEKLHYNPCGVDMSLFAAAAPAQAGPVFLTVGRFVDKKGPLLTLLAFNQALVEVPDARLVMIGDGLLFDAAGQIARAMGMGQAVEFLGAQPHPVVAATMQGARAFVQHSLRPGDGDSEGTPVAVLEAGASGLPVISTRHAGIPDVVIDGETGILVEEGDVDGMAQAMIRLARDLQLAARLGRAGRRRIEERFSMERSIDNLWRIIESVERRTNADR